MRTVTQKGRHSTHKSKIRSVLKGKWESKIMHGQYIRNEDRQLTGEEDAFLRLSRGDLKGENESGIIATQDQALQTKYHVIKILQTETDSKCRLCKQFYETVEYVTAACSILAKEQYIQRYDRVCAQLHFNIWKEIEVKLDNRHWYDHVPKSVATSRGVKVAILLWN